MKAMVLAAGLGTRLRPLTDTRPKALVEVGGRTLLEITLTRLRQFGIRDVIINVHHLAEMVVSYLQSHNNFGVHIEISREDELLLDTGGGLKKAAWFLQDDSSREEPFLLHNVDVISNVDFRKMLDCHEQNRALATLAVQDRETSRYLLFDESLRLSGRKSGPAGKIDLVRQARSPQALAFCGIHIISPRLLSMISEQGAFSIIDAYLRLAGAGENITGFRVDDFYWRDVGRPEQISLAAAGFATGRIS